MAGGCGGNSCRGDSSSYRRDEQAREEHKDLAKLRARGIGLQRQDDGERSYASGSRKERKGEMAAGVT
jgi:hypothetical protein